MQQSTHDKYAEQHEVYFDDGREQELLTSIMSSPPEELEKLRNNPSAILSAIDDFGAKKYLMNIGHLKGKLIADLIQERKPQVMVELGGYVGYSTILFGSVLKVASGKDARYHCIEYNAGFAHVIRELVDLAGLSDVVRITVGSSTTELQRLSNLGHLKRIDFLFLDHLKPLYITDLKLCESLGMIGEGTIIAADNVVKPGNPPYLEYVNMSVVEKIDRIAENEGDDDDNVKSKGDPRLVYESEMIHSFEPTGIPDAVEITRCIGVSGV